MLGRLVYLNAPASGHVFVYKDWLLVFVCATIYVQTMFIFPDIWLLGNQSTFALPGSVRCLPSLATHLETPNWGKVTEFLMNRV